MRTGHNLRDARLEAIPWLGPERLALARAQQVAIVGVGNIGGQCAQHLVLMGIPVLLIDRDVVGVENYATQGFASDVGFGKAEARARWLAPLNRNCKIDHLHADIRHLGMGALRTVSLILSCADNLPTRIAINLSALRLGIPWMDSAIDGTGRTLFGRVAVTFNGAVVLRTLLVDVPHAPPASLDALAHFALALNGRLRFARASWLDGQLVLEVALPWDDLDSRPVSKALGSIEVGVLVSKKECAVLLNERTATCYLKFHEEV